MKKFFSLFAAVLFAGSIMAQFDTWSVVGSKAIMNGTADWAIAETANDMTTEDGVNYTLTVTGKTLEVGTTYEYKYAKGHAWTVSVPQSGNLSLTVTETAVYSIVYNVNVSTGVQTAVPTKTGEAGEITHTYSIAGDNAGLFGAAWSETNTATEMTKGEDGIYSWTKENVELAAGTILYKVVVDHAWGEAYPSQNAQLVIAEDAAYDVVFTFNPANKAVDATATKAGVEPGPGPEPTAGNLSDTLTFYTTEGFDHIDIVTPGQSNTGGDYEFTKGGTTVTGTNGYIYNKKHTVYKSGKMVITAPADIDSVIITYNSNCYPFAEALAGGSTTTKTSGITTTTFIPESETSELTFHNASAGKTELRELIIFYAKGGPEPTTINYYLVGTLAENGWDQNKAMPMEGDSIVRSVAAATYEFKILTTLGSWDNALDYSKVNAECSSEGYENNGGNVKVTLAEAGDVKVSIVDGQICVLGAFGEAVITVYTIAGDAALMGEGWAPAATANDMTNNEGTWTLVKNGVELEAKGYEYKVVANHAWGVSDYPASGNNTLTIAEAATYDVTFTWIPAENSLTANAVKQQGPTPVVTKDTAYYFAGSTTGWTMAAMPYTVSLPKDSTIEFKLVSIVTTTETVEETPVVTKDTTWCGQKTEGYKMTRENIGEGWTLDGTYNVVLTTDAEGEYAFVLNGATLKVTFPTVGPGPEPEPTNYYLAGSMNTPGWSSVAMPGDSIVLTLAAGEHQFKVQKGEGVWDGALSYDNVNTDCSSEGLYTNGDRNVMFTLENAGEVKIKVVEGKICVTGAFKAQEVFNYYIAGTMNGWGSTGMGGDSIVLSLEAGEHGFKVQLVAGYWDNALGYNDLDTECSSANLYTNNDGNVMFTLTAAGEVKVKVVSGKICATGNFVKKESTGLWNTTATEVKKTVVDGQVVIIREGARYNVMGQKF